MLVSMISPTLHRKRSGTTTKPGRSFAWEPRIFRATSRLAVTISSNTSSRNLTSFSGFATGCTSTQNRAPARQCPSREKPWAQKLADAQLIGQQQPEQQQTRLSIGYGSQRELMRHPRPVPDTASDQATDALWPGYTPVSALHPVPVQCSYRASQRRPVCQMSLVARSCMAQADLLNRHAAGATQAHQRHQPTDQQNWPK